LQRFPFKRYITQEGDTLQSVAEQHGMLVPDVVRFNPLPGVPHPHLQRDQWMTAVALWRANGRRPLRNSVGGPDFATRLQEVTLHLQDFTTIPDQQLLDMECGFEHDIAIRDMEVCALEGFAVGTYLLPLERWRPSFQGLRVGDRGF
jgi:hypothetical protein